MAEIRGKTYVAAVVDSLWLFQVKSKAVCFSDFSFLSLWNYMNQKDGCELYLLLDF